MSMKLCEKSFEAPALFYPERLYAWRLGRNSKAFILAHFGKVPDEEARIWFGSGAMLWAVVVKPWVLVQEPVTGSLQ